MFEYAKDTLRDRLDFDKTWLKRHRKLSPNPGHNGYKQIESNIRELQQAIEILQREEKK